MQSYNDILNVNIINHTIKTLGYLQMYNFYSAYSFVNKTLYLFSGFSSFGLSVLAESADTFYQINLNESLPNNYCGAGMEFNSMANACQFCKPGTYSNETDLSCHSCPKGTYNNMSGTSDKFQCLPCPLGTYSSSSGASYCNNCTDHHMCFIGSSLNSKIKENDTDTEINEQPPIYDPTSSFDAIVILCICFSIILLIYVAFYFCNFRLRIFLRVYDIFKTNHIEIIQDDLNEETAQNVKEASASFGAFFTGFTIIIALFIASYYILVFIMSNVQEDQLLVPLPSLLSQEKFDDLIFTVKIRSNSYRGECPKTRPNIAMPVKSSFEIIKFEHDSNNSFCQFSMDVRSKKVVSNGEFILINLTDINSYASEYTVILEADSSIPGKKSIIGRHIEADAGKVLRGNMPSIFVFSLIPSYYKEVSVATTTIKKGYHVFSEIDPVPGSQYLINRLSTTHSMKILLRFEIQASGITTYRYVTQGIVSFFGQLVGAITGTLGAFGVIM